MRLRAFQSLVLSAAVLAACTAPTHSTDARAQPPVASRPAGPQAPDPFGNPYAGQRLAVGRYTYTTDLVEARLGPYRYRFPANFYYDQMGPDFQGSVRLILIWPDLAPTPPGVNFHDDENLSDRYVSISIGYLDKVPVKGYLERMIVPQWGDPSDPTLSLKHRIKGSPVFGLVPYYTDFAKLEAWARRTDPDSVSTVADRDSSMNGDWYLAYRADGSIRTFIKCTSREMPDGIVFEGARVVSAQPPIALCTHDFTVPSLGLDVQMEYARAMLKDWQRTEDRVRHLLDVGRID